MKTEEEIREEIKRYEKRIEGLHPYDADFEPCFFSLAALEWVLDEE